MKLGFTVQMKIQKPVSTVFDAVYNPQKLAAYFTTGGASAPLKEGTIVEWGFADNPGEPAQPFPVAVKKVVQNELITLSWEGAKGLQTKVEMQFGKAGSDATVVKISETGWRENQGDLEKSYLNCQGWAQMLSCLKAYVEYGINLRKGAYEGLYKSEES